MAEDTPFSAQSQNSENIAETDPPTPIPRVKAELERVIGDLPQPRKDAIIHSVEEMFLGIVQGSAVPHIDRETALVLAASADKESDHKFEYLLEQEKNDAAQDQRTHEFAVERFRTKKLFLWPIIVTVLVLTVGGLIWGVRLASEGHEVLGSNLITAVLAGIFAYLAGLGTANFFKKDDDE